MSAPARRRRTVAPFAIAYCGLAVGGSALLAAPSASAFTSDVGDVAVIEDPTGGFHDTTGFWGPDKICREAAKLFLRCHADEYDVLVAFDAKPSLSFEDMIRNVQQGTPVKNDIDGIGYTRFNFTSVYGSAGRLGQCVSMAALNTIPDDPDGPATALLGLPLGITGVELMGHELGHKWLMGVTFDKNDGQGPQHFLRGFEGESPNLHYSHWANSQSVMYGSFITELGDGGIRVCGGERGYNSLDQYLMGLRPASEVEPIAVYNDGSGQGSASIPSQRGVCGNYQGFTRVDVTVGDVQRASGQRNPAFGAAPRSFRIGFMLATQQGVDATPAQIAKVDTYRRRFEQWFAGATQNRGNIDTHLGPLTCTPDGGGVPDGGFVLDAGVARDGGKPPEDGGPDGGPDAGLDAGRDGGPIDAGLATTDGGATGDDDAGIPGGVDAGGGRADAGRRGGGSVSGCSCEVSGGRASGSGSSGVVALLLCALFLAWRRRRSYSGQRKARSASLHTF